MKIKMLVMDVDGTLTDGCIYMGAGGEMMKAFNVQDGAGIVFKLPKMGITPVIITGRKSQITQCRAEELGITHLYQGIREKLPQLMTVAAELGIKPEEIACIGDDRNDMACMEWCGFSACPADAVPEVLETADFVCKRQGGRGAVRELIDHLEKLWNEMN